jgi:hypothetical protein
MPSPSAIVTFTDADGDSFPVRVWGQFNDSLHRKLLRLAKQELERQKAEGMIRPRGATFITGIEI